jgi:hypothetical protein
MEAVWCKKYVIITLTSAGRVALVPGDVHRAENRGRADPGGDLAWAVKPFSAHLHRNVLKELMYTITAVIEHVSMPVVT